MDSGFQYQIYAYFYAQMIWNCMALHGALCLHNFRKRSNHAGLRTYMKVYRYMKKVGLRRYLISSIKPSFFECSHDVNSYIISIAYSPCACKKILWFTWESFLNLLWIKSPYHAHEVESKRKSCCFKTNCFYRMNKIISTKV